ncbi:BMP family ABC transporter substrate-binding protein [Actinomadura logoneensis]|uniref:BMP family ABC transporter substrate-binding protein n=1 Tax=Actinomadura logoneensis TaxID=2293572 RepID=A0A372JBB5_9ACTN|nr:BMP family ABC transporter substrate-binding protein [Actinomadura logoneensis]RFU37297.1 BMP family ABC transporter substrate-binding protein [Actinomadura logoneensis]
MRARAVRPGLGLGLVLAGCAVAGCGAPTPARPEGVVRVGVALTPDGLGDLALNDSALAGLDRARKDADIEPVTAAARAGETDADREARVRNLAGRGLPMVVALGSAYTAPVERVAASFPRTRFLIVDPAGCAVTGRNVMGACFHPEKAAYLAGAAAALRSRTGVLGFVGGRDAWTARFQRGFEAGARKARPDVRLLPARFAASPAEGRAAAKAETDAGADVVFQAAGGAGEAVVQTVAAAGRYVVGSVGDQYAQPRLAAYRDRILTSALVRVDLAVARFVHTALPGAGFLQGTVKLDLASGGAAYSTAGGHLEDLRPRLERLKYAEIDHPTRM